jgi:prepilin-type N-terminal cleavage/methylation domain-containing protein
MTSERGGRSGFSLLEVVAVVGVVALVAAIALPRLPDLGATAVDVGARRLAGAATTGRDDAILGGRPVRLVLDLDAGRWTMGREGAALPPGVRLRAVAIGADVARAGVVTVTFDPAGDPLPVWVDLADGRGHGARVVVPAAGSRVHVTR